MNSSKFNMTRRSFLGGAGAMVALPFLPSMWPKAHAANTANNRLLVFYTPNGFPMSRWTIDGTGREWSTSQILSPIDAVKDDVSVLSGLFNMPAYPEGSGGHACGTSGLLTCVQANKTESVNIRSGISMDQVAVNELNPNTTFPSLQLGTDGGANIGNCDSGYSCAYVRNISWASETTPLPKIVDPLVLFDRFFAGSDPTASREVQEKRRRYNASVLDYVSEQARSLKGKLGRTDNLKLDEYLTGVRELEVRITQPTSLACGDISAPEEDLVFLERVDAMKDLMVTAFRCDLTRIMTFMMGNGISNRSFTFLGVTGGHHELSHHQDDPARIDLLEKIGRWEVEQFVDLINRMKSTPDGEDGETLLDNSMVVFTSEMGEGNSHSQRGMPILLAGGGAGQLDPGNHYIFENQEPLANFHMTMLQAMGAPVSSFGSDGTGALQTLIRS